MTMDKAIRVNALSQAVIDAKEWRETFEQNADADHAVVEFDEVNARKSVDDGTTYGFDGRLRMPRDIAIEMMKWLEERATHALGE